MKIKLNSWHTRLCKDFYHLRTWDLPESLCGYFWTLIGAVLGSIAISPLSLPPLLFKRIREDEDLQAFKRVFISVFGIAGLFAVVGFFHGIYDFYMWRTVEGYKSDRTWMITLIVLVAAGLLIALYAHDKLESKSPSKSTILGSYLKAKKDKICPRIEWED